MSAILGTTLLLMLAAMLFGSLFIVLYSSINRLMNFVFVRCLTDRFLLEMSLLDECDGEPMNIYAEEFQRRDQKKAGAA